jgi:hypothetical protein
MRRRIICPDIVHNCAVNIPNLHYANEDNKLYEYPKLNVLIEPKYLSPQYQISITRSKRPEPDWNSFFNNIHKDIPNEIHKEEIKFVQKPKREIDDNLNE